MSKGFTHESQHNESIEWYTPPEIFESLGLEFDLDPCSPGQGKTFVPAKKVYTVEDDGLKSPWNGTVFVNPPYGNHTPVWMRKASEHGDGIALVFSRTDVKWFQELSETFGAVCFISGRVKFFKGNTEERGGTPGTGSMLIAWGDKSVEALRNSGLGVVYTMN